MAAERPATVPCQFRVRPGSEEELLGLFGPHDAVLPSMEFPHVERIDL